MNGSAELDRAMSPRVGVARRFSRAAGVFALALGGAAAVAAQTTPPRLWTDPVVSTLGQPVRALVDLRGDAGWCNYRPSGVTVEGSTLVLHLPVAILDPPALCARLEAPPRGIFTFALPPEALGTGFHALRLDTGGPEPAAFGGIHVVPSASRLEVQNGKFAITVRFLDPRTGVWSDAHAAPFSSEGGTYWFFSDRNQELQIKVLDGRTVNDHWWIFLASQTTLEASIEVTHRTTACTRGYNPLPCPQWTFTHAAGAAHNVQDVNAFADQP